ncbi:MerR family transcriptional regulator [Streptosporangium sp. NPDC006007]|uniref:MerR family transcriptional regulator n=1 Tax=Streptosporangium sp. NPDC006007 TaxID=3154575 RepID=UPI0033A11C36
MLDHVNDDLLPIGRFARLCRLSVKQLRHYAELGLLVPAWVDPDSGYRYYRADQAREALSIGLLRSLDVPLSAIGEVLSGTAPAQALGRVRDDLEAELARRHRTLATLERLLSRGLPEVEVNLTGERARHVALARDVAVTERDIPRAVAGCVARLTASPTGAPGGRRPPGTPDDADGVAGEVRLTGLFPVELGERIPVAVAIELDDLDDPVPPGSRPGVLPGGVFACATHVGPYNQINLTAHALLSWCAERGHAPRDPFREVYLSDPASTPPERLVTRLMIRLENPLDR